METNNIESSVNAFLGETPAKETEEAEDTQEEHPEQEPAIEEDEEDSKDEESEEESEVEEEEEEDLGELTPREKALIAHLQSLKSDTPQETSEEDGKLPPLVVTETIIDFLEGVKDEEVDDILADRSKLNTLLNKVYNKAKAEAAAISAEHILKSLPATISTYSKKQVELHMMIAEFYRDNRDLNNPVAKQLLGTVANQINDKNPGIEFSKLMQQSATQVRKLLALKGTEMTKGGVKKKETPAFAGQQKGASRVKGEKLSAREQAMIDLIPTN